MLVRSKSRPIVVVADDDAATRYVITSTLAHEGFSVIEAGNGQEAIDAFKRSCPDVILMDVEMPGTDGYQACSVIRHSEGGADLPVVMVTGHDDSESINRAYEVGATDFISKPINWSLIGHRLRYILRGVRNFQALGISEVENRALIAAIPDSIFIVSGDGTILNHVSGGNSSGNNDGKELSGKSILSVLPDGLGNDIGQSIDSVLSTGENTAIEYQVERPGDESRWYESRFVHHGDKKVLVIIRDISDRKHAEKKIHRLAYYDSLTGLPNRPLFKEQVQKELEVARSGNGSLALFNIDLNRFKRINDTLGSSTGDDVLVKMATRLSKYVDSLRLHQSNGTGGPDSCLASFGGNEFALLLSGLSHPSDFTLIAEQLRKLLAEPVMLKGHEFVVTASIGVAMYPEHGASVEALLKNAESARDEAKHLGGNTQKLYRSSMNSGVTECLNLENELRRALENDELSMYYQPKYCANTREHRGAEALLRWFHPERGEISPTAFIPIAEESGLITELGCWVANNVCQQISSWEYFGISPGPIAINISGQEFSRGDPVATLTAAVSKADIARSALELEITETVLMSDIRSVMLALHALREEGFSLAVDDFGTGYSSLRYLQKFPIDVLKIDSSFVHDVERNSDSRAICTAIIALARSLGLKVVGEGVESNWQLEFLKRQACDMVQGFLLSKPLSPNDFADHLKTGLPRSGSIDHVIQLSSHM